MLSLAIPGSTRLCDGLTRRHFLKIGAFSFGAFQFSLADLFKAEAAQGKRSHKALIHIFLGGGPPHQDLWDIKTEAPKEIRGEFQPIPTNVPGIQICEVFPRLAKLMDKCVIIRSIVGALDRHAAEQCMTGWPHVSLANLGGRPSVGAVVAKLQGPVDPAIPPFVGLAQPTQHRPWSDPGQPGFLGPSYSAFRPDGEGLRNMKLNGITIEHLYDRRRLIQSFDHLRRDLDASGQIAALDSMTQRAFDVLTSSKLLEALDLSREPESVRQRYGDGKPYKFQYDGAPTVNDQLLLARRLVEAGVRVVTLTYGRWDSHGNNFGLVRDHGGKLDQCLSALLEDLEQRGMLQDVTVLVWGEFGRTPRINKDAGRDHWPQVSCALLAGGGMRTGQVIGATNRLGEYAAQRPVTFQEVIATVYHNLGIDPATTTILDPTGRPQHLVQAEPLREVI
ncbi:MAG: DUF1501 domain-containing protein [Gemmatales bacterium]|nr:DUF1501 domain-containing protein [Gemmatales bacterium]MDW8223016.1 DUF1501 domain-containing protein [Gemmatales bacterium]